ncbi:hypothetical protein MUA03_15730 [Enterobacteriaceae bacterium H16N7]|nr:hypothetical protein [Dryocola clanedunensis]
MSLNWSRHFELQLLGKDGGGIVLSGFKVKFTVNWRSGSAPKTADVTIYNLSSETLNRITQNNEFAKIRLIAGYNGLMPVVSEDEVGKVREVTQEEWGQRDGQNFGLIFSGDIRITIAGWEVNTPDSSLLIQAVDGHEALTSAVVSETLAKGYKVEDLYNRVLTSLAKYQIVGGKKPPFPTTVFPRGYTLHGKASFYLDQIGKLCNASWKLVDDRLDYYSNSEEKSEPIRLNGNNGLIGRPQTTTGSGVNICCLINPNIVLNGRVQLEQSQVYRASATADGDKLPSWTPVATDGIYQVYGITYSGDTRAQDWYMKLSCWIPGTKPAEKKTAS